MRQGQNPNTAAHGINEAHGSSDASTSEQLCEKKDLFDNQIGKLQLKIHFLNKIDELLQVQIQCLSLQKPHVEVQILLLKSQISLIEHKKLLSADADWNIALSSEEDNRVELLNKQIDLLFRKANLLDGKIDLSLEEDNRIALQDEKDKKIALLDEQIALLDKHNRKIALPPDEHKDVKIALMDEQNKKTALLDKQAALSDMHKALLDKQNKKTALLDEKKALLDKQTALPQDEHKDVKRVLIEKQIAFLDGQIAKLDEQIAFLEEQIALLYKQIALLDEEIALLPDVHKDVKRALLGDAYKKKAISNKQEATLTDNINFDLSAKMFEKLLDKDVSLLLDEQIVLLDTHKALLADKLADNIDFNILTQNVELDDIGALLDKIDRLLDELIPLSVNKRKKLAFFDDRIALKGQKILLQTDKIASLAKNIALVDEKMAWYKEQTEENPLLQEIDITLLPEEDEKIALLDKQVALLDKQIALLVKDDKKIVLLDKMKTLLVEKEALLDDRKKLYADKQTLFAEQRSALLAEVETKYEELPEHLKAKLSCWGLPRSQIYGLFSHLMNLSEPIFGALVASIQVYVLMRCTRSLYIKATDALIAEVTPTATHGLFSQFDLPGPTFEDIRNVFIGSALLSCYRHLFNKNANGNSDSTYVLIAYLFLRYYDHVFNKNVNDDYDTSNTLHPGSGWR